jgi:hypothetical protein
MFEQCSWFSGGLRAASTAVSVGMLAAVSGIALGAQDKYTVQTPDGLGFSDFRGYEKWEVMATSLGPDATAVILGNPAMIDALKAGIPGNGQKFPDGAKMAKIHWTKKMNAEGFPATVPDVLHDIDFMAKDNQRFAGSGGWGYAQFNYDAASDAFTPLGTGANCGYACHQAAAAKDYVFTAYPKR